MLQILHNLEAGLCEDGSPAELNPSDRNESRKLWANREARVLHSIVNCALYQKVCGNQFNAYIFTEWIVVPTVLFTKMLTLFGKEPRMPQSVKSLAMGWKPSIQLPVGANIFLCSTFCSPLILLSSGYHWLFLQE